MTIIKTVSGLYEDGREICLFTLDNQNGTEVKISNYGATVTSVKCVDRNGETGNVVLGFDNPYEYMKDHPHFGGIIGRYANRIAGGRFTLDGKEYSLVKNNGNNHLHGGNKGFDRVLWNARQVKEGDEEGVELRYTSPDREEGYPGRLDVRVVYKLTKNNELEIYYEASCDQSTIVNLTNHMYLNLNHDSGNDILGHEMMINASAYTASDQDLIPTGEIRSVSGSPYDFRESRSIGERIHIPEGGYDNNYVLDKPDSTFGKAACLYEPLSGRICEVYTTEPGMQLYTGNFLDGTFTGHNKTRYKKYNGICLEAQHFPDSPNRQAFPGVILRPGEVYMQRTVYAFGVRRG